MRDVDERDFQLLLNALQLSLHIFPETQIKRTERLIQQENPRTAYQGARNGDTLLLPAGKRRTRPPFVSAEVHEFEHFHHAAADFLFGKLLQPETERHVFKDVQVRKQRVPLKDGVDLAFVRRHVVDACAFKKQVAR